MFSLQISGEIVEEGLGKVKQEVCKMASVAEKVYMDLVARGKDMEDVRYIGKYLNMQ